VLREVLFRLWGDLEEKKSALLKEQYEKALKAAEKSTESNTTANTTKAPAVMPGDELPPDSDDESTPQDRTARNSSKVVLPESDTKNETERSPFNTDQTDLDLSAAISSLPIANKGFTCCIQQYGIRVPEKSSSKADAGEGFKWKRIFGLFGTQIA
jgi:protection-of-telomeres protein 1